MNLRETLLRTRGEDGKPISQNQLASDLSDYIDSIVTVQTVNYWVMNSVPAVWKFVLKQFFAEREIEVVE
jgi:hypothetical protein